MRVCACFLSDKNCIKIHKISQVRFLARSALASSRALCRIFIAAAPVHQQTQKTSPVTASVRQLSHRAQSLALRLYCAAGLVESALELHRLDVGEKEPRVVTAMTRLKQRLFQCVAVMSSSLARCSAHFTTPHGRYQGHVSAALVLGGVDVTGPHIYTVYPHGSTDKLPYATMGSGSLAAMSVFEQKYKDDLDVRLWERLCL